jgi:hypothetical protein
MYLYKPHIPAKIFSRDTITPLHSFKAHLGSSSVMVIPFEDTTCELSLHSYFIQPVTEGWHGNRRENNIVAAKHDIY